MDWFLYDRDLHHEKVKPMNKTDDINWIIIIVLKYLYNYPISWKSNYLHKLKNPLHFTLPKDLSSPSLLDTYVTC